MARPPLQSPVLCEVGDLGQESRDNQIYVSRARNHCVIMAAKTA